MKMNRRAILLFLAMVLAALAPAGSFCAAAENGPEGQDVRRVAEDGAEGRDVRGAAAASPQILPTAVNHAGTLHGPAAGHLVIIGGGPIPDEVWDTFVAYAGGPSARLVVITNASGDEEAYQGPALEALGRRVPEGRVTRLHLRDIDQANDPALIAPLEEADGVFFTGGRQWRIAEVYLNTRAHRALNAVLERGGVIGGTSAGASIQGSFLWRGDTRGPDITVGDHTQGLGFMKCTVIDQHLFARHREADLLPFIAAAPEYVGIGIDESTAVLVERDSIRVAGLSRVALYLPGLAAPLLLEPGEGFDLGTMRPSSPSTAHAQIRPLDASTLPGAEVGPYYVSAKDQEVMKALEGCICDPVLFSDERFRWQQLVVPGTLLAAGTFGALSPWYKDHVNAPVRAYAQQLSGGRQLGFDDWIQYLPVIGYVGLGFGVRSGEHGLPERLCVTATAYAAQGLMTNALKYTIREQRPDSDARNAFPSGHTATAFMGAELVRREYGPWWGAGAYAVATTTALMRLYNDRHWTNDLLGGAAIGILSADIGFWLLPLERRLFGIVPGSGKALTVLPTPYGVSVACVF